MMDLERLKELEKPSDPDPDGEHWRNRASEALNALPDLIATVERLTRENEELREAILDGDLEFVALNCTVMDKNGNPKPELDSMAITANADAMRRLSAAGELEIVREFGRRVIGRWKK